uniref:Uncharacterized protein n=1 Tax=Romanomermis culicivorax TaxID=13658 RepID=A0A915HTH3_ROMCU
MAFNVSLIVIGLCALDESWAIKNQEALKQDGCTIRWFNYIKVIHAIPKNWKALLRTIKMEKDKWIFETPELNLGQMKGIKRNMKHVKA